LQTLAQTQQLPLQALAVLVVVEVVLAAVLAATEYFTFSTRMETL
jgi:hypothetical protein